MPDPQGHAGAPGSCPPLASWPGACPPGGLQTGRAWMVWTATRVAYASPWILTINSPVLDAASQTSSPLALVVGPTASTTYFPHAP